MTALDLQRIRARAALRVVDSINRATLIKRIQVMREDVGALADEVEALWKRLEREWSPPKEPNK